MAAKYELKITSDGQFMFNIKAANGEIVLTSERYTAKSSAEAGIESVRANAPIDERYDRRKSSKDAPYFVLKAANGEITGKSEMYSSSSAKDNDIESVKTNGPSAPFEDITQ